MGINKIAKHAKVDKRLIYRYFGSGQNLIETYISERDYWLKLTDNKNKFEQCSSETVEDFVTRLLLEQFDYLYNDKETQGLIHWEISEKNDLLNSIAGLRENKASQLFERIDKEIKSTEIDFRSVSALLVAGIYYLNLHHRVNDSTFCEIDINNPIDQQKLKQTISQIVHIALSTKRVS